jgi:hypothetical protein
LLADSVEADAAAARFTREAGDLLRLRELVQFFSMPFSAASRMVASDESKASTDQARDVSVVGVDAPAGIDSAGCSCGSSPAIRIWALPVFLARHR